MLLSFIKTDTCVFYYYPYPG